MVGMRHTTSIVPTEIMLFLALGATRRQTCTNCSCEEITVKVTYFDGVIFLCEKGNQNFRQLKCSQFNPTFAIDL